MKSKRVSIILIAVAFMFIVVFSCVGLFSVKKVQVSYAVSDKYDSAKIQSALNDFLGDNLLFFYTAEVEKALGGYHYMEILSVKKQYPNVLKVSLKERREIYYIGLGDNYYVTTEDGFILKSVGVNEFSGDTSRDKILLELDGVNVVSAAIGNYIKTDDDDLMGTVFEMAKSVNLTDCIKSITVVKQPYSDNGVNVYDASFNTYSGVSMCIEKILVDGVVKTQNAFDVYDGLLTDYQKADGEIQSYVMDDGRYRVTYNQKAVWTSEN